MGFEPTTLVSKVRVSSAELATQEHWSKAGCGDGVALSEPGLDDLPEKQELYQLPISPARCPGLSIRISMARWREAYQLRQRLETVRPKYETLRGS